MNTLLLLIDFYGHPALTTDDTSDSVRYSQLNKILSSTQIDRDKFTIFTTPISSKDHRLLELKRIGINNRFKFIEDENYSLESLSQIYEPEQVIVTGTNTSGCVFANKSIGAYHWSRAGYKTKIYLPMCCEYEHEGINDYERNSNGFAQLYTNIKKYNCFDIDIVKDFSKLELPV